MRATGYFLRAWAMLVILTEEHPSSTPMHYICGVHASTTLLKRRTECLHSLLKTAPISGYA